jgi:DNA-binding NarL/FixJ family response regulator
MNRKIKLMLIEDNPEYRDVIDFSLKGDPDIELESQYSTAEVALRNLQDLSSSAAPDLILLDLNLPGMSGLEAIPWIKKYVLETRIIILSQSNQKSDILKAISDGVDGYLLKSSTLDQVKNSIRSVMKGGASLDSEVARLIMNSLQNTLPEKEKDPGLSKKEMKILSLIADGLQKKEISAQLKISNNTVDTHVRHIYEKLNVQNAPAAVSEAYKSGLFKH